MSQLTDISVVARKYVLIGIGLLVSYFIFIFMLKLAIGIIRSAQKPRTVAPDTRFGQIPPPRFVDFADLSTGLTFTLLNVEGIPTEATASAKVYEIPKKLPTFSITQRATSLAKKLDFNLEPRVEDTMYYFVADKNPRRVLTIEGVYLNYQLKYDYRDQPDIFVPVKIANKEELQKSVTGYIDQRNLFDDTVLKGRATLKLLRLDPVSNELVPASSIANSTAVRVDFFRQDIDKLPLITPKFFESYNYAVFAPSTKIIAGYVLELNYTFWPISLKDMATYPLKTSQEAYTQLTEGKAYVINKGQNSTEITIRKIYLAYFDDSQQQEYLQPVFVFEGDRDFVALTPAITGEWLK